MKNMKKWVSLLLSLALMLACTSVLADTTLTVSGTGDVRVSADTAVISLGVTSRSRDVLQAQQKANETIVSVRKALAEKGVKEEDISTEFINIYAMYDYQSGEEQLSAYNASSTLSVHVTDMESIGALIDAAFAAGANTLNGISFSASDTKEAEAEAMRKAVANAKEKAEILADASGLKITGIESISEGGVYSYENSTAAVRAAAFGKEEAADAGTVVQAARLVVSASVSITFKAE